MRRLSVWFSATLAVLSPGALLAQAATRPADLVITGARINTVDASRPTAEAIAVRGGKVVFVGNLRGAQALTGPNTEKWDLSGKTIVPGVVDAHGHLLGLGQALRSVDLVGTKSYDEIVARVVAWAKTVPAGQWIRGRGWDQNDWADTRFPTHEALSKAVPNNPVYLTRVDGHAALVNAKALEAAKLTAATKDPEGGRIIRDPQGNPSGVLVDRAQGLVGSVIPPWPRAEVRAQTIAAIAHLNEMGLTGMHDAGVSGANIEVYEEIAKAGQYNLRNYVMIRDVDSVLDRYMAAGPKNGEYDRLWIRSIKITADGALGSRGAAMLEPYSDETGNSGFFTDSMARIKRVAIKALKAGFQLNVHAIGDRANRSVLDMYEAALDEVPTPDHRFRIEHAQILHYDDIPRFAELGVIPSMQGSHQTSDMYWATNRIGVSRILGAYAWRSLLNTGVVIPNGSDFPVESANPLISFHAFFTREDEHEYPAGGWHPEQKTTREEALLSMTLWAAYGSFMENETGSITPGKFADFTVFDQDIMSIAPERILETKVEMTVIGGKPVYRRGAPKT